MLVHGKIFKLFISQFTLAIFDILYLIKFQGEYVMNKEIKEGFVEGLIETGKNFAKEQLGELIPKVVSESSLQFGLEVVGGTAIEMVPFVGHIASSYFTKRKIKNEHEFISEIAKRVEDIEKNMSSKTIEQKEILDDLAVYAYEKAIQTNQEEKISYIVNGFVNMTKIDTVSEDIAYIYYDTLEQLTILDISVLKLYGKAYLEIDSAANYSEILEQFGIEYHQYDAVRKNLQRISLLEDSEEEKFDKHFKDFVKVFNGNMKLLASFKNPRKFDTKEFGKLKDIKEYRPRENLRISKFGKDFLRFFAEENQ
jgi:hypothetical protein|nr:MAG TPA: hypothetical protein [Caudoviricetes sp.]